MDVKIAETVADVQVIKCGLSALIEKGYAALKEFRTDDSEALKLATEWDGKIDTAKKLLKEIEKNF